MGNINRGVHDDDAVAAAVIVVAVVERSQWLLFDDIPDDVVVIDVMKYLTQRDVVSGLSEVNKYISKLCRSRIEIKIDVYPNEVITAAVGWTNITGVRCQATVWSRRGVRYEEFMEGVKKDNEKGYFTVNALRERLKVLEWKKPSLLVFNVEKLQTLPLKSLKLNEIALEKDNLMIIQPIKTIESLTFKECDFKSALDMFPPKLKKLTVRARFGTDMRIGNLPESLKSLECHAFELVSTKNAQLILQSGLLRLDISEMKGSNQDPVEKLPFEFPPNLKELKVSNMWKLQMLPSVVQLNSLESLEVSLCDKLTSIPVLPSSLRKLKIDRCPLINKLDLPKHLEELECAACRVLEVDILALPSQLKKLTIDSCNKMRNVTHLGQFPAHLQELTLEGFDNLVELPDLPFGLHSLVLHSCCSLEKLPILPQTLRNLELYDVGIEDILSLPEDLEYLSFSNCNHLKMIGQLPRMLQSLKVLNISKFSLVDSSLPEMLKIFNVRGCSGFKIDLINLPHHLEVLKLEDQSGIDSIPSLPKMKTLGLCELREKVLPSLPGWLQNLVIERCNSIQVFPVLPPSLQTLRIEDCNQIEFIGLKNESTSANKIGIHGKIPDSLRGLSLQWCVRLEKIGELPSNLHKLRIANCGVVSFTNFPRHLQDLNI